MKKISIVMLIVVVCYSLVACNQIDEKVNIAEEENEKVQVVVEEEKEEIVNEDSKKVIEEEIIEVEVIPELSKEEIIWLQESLTIADFYTNVDGDFGNATKQQVEKFNEFKNIPYLEYTNKTKLELEKIRIEKLAPNYKTDMVLINKDYYLPADFEPENLREVNVPKNKYIELPGYVADIVEEMFKDAKEDGLNIYLASGFRSYEYQQGIFNRKVGQQGFLVAQTIVAIPGRSEHQTGLAIDITNSNMQFGLQERFDQEKEFRWMAENAYKYGFILRYKKNREDTTTYIYEPWHYRYVGDVEMAKYIHDNNIVLEEYYANKGY